jgi:hypothetical protein
VAAAAQKALIEFHDAAEQLSRRSHHAGAACAATPTRSHRSRTRGPPVNPAPTPRSSAR